MANHKIQRTFQSALQHHQAGRLQEAEQIYRRVLEKDPLHIDALHNLGVNAIQTGRKDLAEQLLRRAIALKPNFPEAYGNLANILQQKGQLDQAIAAYRQAIAGKPDVPDTHCNLALVLREKGHVDEAIAACHRAIALRPDLPEAYNNLGNAMKDKGELDEAVAAYRRAIALRPTYAEAHSNLGKVLTSQGQIDQAVAACRRAIALSPSFPGAHSNLGLALLTRGEYQQGWEEYEWRWECGDFTSARRNFAQPRWDGSPLKGRTLLLHAEQGFGDTIQFFRYLPLAAQQGGHVVVECQAELQRLLQPMAGGCQVIAEGQDLPRFDVHCPLLGLPRIFRTTLANIPAGMPYLKPDSDDAGTWQRRLAGDSRALKVGLVWAGLPTHNNDRNRSLKLSSLAPLARVPGVRFVSLQKGEASIQAKTPPRGMELVDWTEDLKDFSDTAALIANLDLVIAVDTAVMHLAGAMGKPVWTLLPAVPDWRWLLEGEDSPWYPSMRLFRQTSRGDWDGVISRVADALSLQGGIFRRVRLGGRVSGGLRIRPRLPLQGPRNRVRRGGPRNNFSVL